LFPCFAYLIAFIVLQSTPEMAIRATDISFKHPMAVFATDLHFQKNPGVLKSFVPDYKIGDGTLYSAHKDNYIGMGYYSVKKMGLLYFAKFAGGR
jgi:hypothetical protein